MNITWIVFDIGGVVVPIDMPSATRELAERSETPYEDVLALFGEPFEEGESELTITEAFQLGQLSTEDYLSKLQSILKKQLPTSQIREIRERVLLGQDEKVVDLIAKLKREKRVACFSNTHPIHWDYMISRYSVFNLFEVKMASHIAGTAKPYPSSFEYMCQQLRAKPEECIYIDDLKKNVAGAQRCGWHAVHYTGIDSLREALGEFGIVVEEL